MPAPCPIEGETEAQSLAHWAGTTPGSTDRTLGEGVPGPEGQQDTGE